MKYTTANEWDQFEFADAYLTEIQKINGYFQLTLDNVTILPDNSCNRDIRKMRANGLYFKIQNGQVESFVEEGYKVYNADGKLMDQYEDRILTSEEYNDTLKALADGESCIYAMKKMAAAKEDIKQTEQDIKTDSIYEIIIDGSNERTYVLRIRGTKDVEEWDRFLSI